MSENVVKNEERAGAAKLLGGRISCLVGLLFGAGGILFALLGTTDMLSAGAVGAGLGVLGYFLGARSLGVATIGLGVFTVFFVAAVSTGLIPGLSPLGHGYE